jgi:UDP:flavonoid glycosyltransferase YjiC (YdhE family)
VTVATGRPLRLLIGAFGDPGHAFPAIALGKELTARGHEVALQTWRKWREHVEYEGMAFHAAPEYQVFPTRDRPLKPYEAVVRAAAETRPIVREFEPDVLVSDILTLAPALAGELEGCRCATLIPHSYPPPAADVPPYGLGAMPATHAIGRAAWRVLGVPVSVGLERGRVELNETRRRVGLPALAYRHNGISRRLCLVATFPHLEYPRSWPDSVHVTGPLLWEPPADSVSPPAGDAPLVMVAPSTSQDRGHRLLEVALRGLAGLPVRVLATYGRHLPPRPIRVPPNARLVEWASYSSTMPTADVVVCHGGHGTVALALCAGTPVVTVPAAGDMPENGARVQWAGAGLSLPARFLSPRSLMWCVQTVLEDLRFRSRASELAAWHRRHDGAKTAARLVEDYATAGSREAGAVKG